MQFARNTGNSKVGLNTSSLYNRERHSCRTSFIALSFLFLSFLEIMADAVKTPNVVEATNKQGLFEKLEDIQVLHSAMSVTAISFCVS